MLLIIFSSCKNYESRWYFREGLVFKIISQDKMLGISNYKDINNSLLLDSNQKQTIQFIQFDFDSNQVVSDFLLDFPNVRSIDFLKCSDLNLSRNNESVKSINIHSCQQVIKNLHQLENVGLIHYECSSDNKINFGNLAEFKKMKNLKCLELDLRENTILNNDIGSLDSLEVLRLNYVSFDEIPKSISKLNHLIELSINTDYEVTIPKCILKMKSLRELNFKGNPCVVYQFNKKYKNKYPNLKVLSWQRIPDLDQKYDNLKFGFIE